MKDSPLWGFPRAYMYNQNHIHIDKKVLNDHKYPILHSYTCISTTTNVPEFPLLSKTGEYTNNTRIGGWVGTIQ